MNSVKNMKSLAYLLLFLALGLVGYCQLTDVDSVIIMAVCSGVLSALTFCYLKNNHVDTSYNKQAMTTSYDVLGDYIDIPLRALYWFGRVLIKILNQ